MNRYFKITLSWSLGLLWPSLTLADGRTLSSIVGWFVGAVNQLVVIIVAAALLLFFWGVAVYIFKLGSAGSENNRGPQFMFWGIVILFVMTTLWGLVYFIGDSIF